MSIEDRERWERLAALGVKKEIPTPEGEARMSAVILQIAEPLIQQYGKTEERAKAILLFTIAGWNKSLLPPDKQPIVEQELINRFVPKDGSAEVVGIAVHIMDFAADRRKTLFPNLHKIIVDSDVEIKDGHLTLNVSSARVPEAWQPNEGQQGVEKKE